MRRTDADARAGRGTAGLLLLALAAGGAGAATAADDFDASEPAELTQALADAALGYVSPWGVNYADFHPQSPASAACIYSAYLPDGGAWLAADSDGGTCCIVAPVHLPDGVTVTSIFFYLYDNSADNFTMSLRRKRIGNTTASAIMGTVSSTGTGTSVRIFPDISITNPVIDNSLFAYYVSSDTCLDQGYNMRYYQALIFYAE